MIMIQVTEALPGSRFIEISARHTAMPELVLETARVVTNDGPFRSGNRGSGSLRRIAGTGSEDPGGRCEQ